MPSQTIEGVKRDLEGLIERVKEEVGPFESEVRLLESNQQMFMPPFRNEVSDPVVQSVMAAHETYSGQKPQLGGRTRFAGSDAAHMAQAGMKGLLYGPSGDSTSTPWERVRIADYVLAAKVFTHAAIEMASMAV